MLPIYYLLPMVVASITRAILSRSIGSNTKSGYRKNRVENLALKGEKFLERGINPRYKNGLLPPAFVMKNQI
jgi:hypothetical protein